MLVDWCLTAFSAQTGYIVPYEYEIYHVGSGDKDKHTMKQYIKPRVISALRPGLCGVGFLRGVFLANHLAGTDNLTRKTKRQNRD